MASRASAPSVFLARWAWAIVRANTDATVPSENMRCSSTFISRCRRASSDSSSSSESSNPSSSSSSSPSSSSSSGLWEMMSWAPPASLPVLDTSPPESSESARRRDVRVRPGLVAFPLPERPPWLLGVLSSGPLLPLGAVVPTDTFVAPAATSDSFRTARPSLPRLPSKFELTLSFGGDMLAALFFSDIPEPVAAFSRPAPTILGATFNVFELVETIVV